MTPRWGYCDATPTELSCTPSAYTIAPRAHTRLHPDRAHTRLHPERIHDCTPSAYTIAPRANTRLHPERSRGVGVYNTFLVSASLDEQCLAAPRAETRGATRANTRLHPGRSRGVRVYNTFLVSASLDEQCLAAPRAEPRLHPERSRGVILHFHINKNPLLITRAGFLCASIQMY